MTVHQQSGQDSRREGLALRHPVLLGSLGFGILSFLLPIYGKQLGGSALDIGGLFSIFAIMTVVLRPPVGWGIDRFGRKPFFVAALLCYALTMACFAISDSMAGLYIARAAQGVASAFMWISAYTIATDLASAARRGGAVGRVDESSARGQIYGAFAGFALLGILPLQTGWRTMFIAYALLATVGAWLAWRFTPETKPAPPARADGRQVLSRPFLRLLVIVFIAGLSMAMLSPLLLIFLQDKFTTDPRLLALAFIPAALIYALLPSRTGRLSDRFGRAPLIAFGLVGSGLVSLFIPGLPSIGWLILLWAMEALGFVTAAPAQEAMVADFAGAETRGTGYGMYTLAANLGATVGPLIGGWLYDSVGHAVPFYLNGAVLLASAVWALLLLGRRTAASKT